MYNLLYKSFYLYIKYFVYIVKHILKKLRISIVFDNAFIIDIIMLSMYTASLHINNSSTEIKKSNQYHHTYDLPI